MHHNGIIVVNGGSTGLSHVVEISQGQGALELSLQTNKRVTRYIKHYLRTMLLSLTHLLSRGPAGQNLKVLIGYSAYRGKVGGRMIWGVVGQDKDRR